MGSSPSPLVDKQTDDQIIFRLTDDQFKIMREVAKARGFAELKKNPYFDDFCKLAEFRLDQIREQFLDPKRSYDKDTAWLMRERYVGIEQFWQSLMMGLAIAQETLENPAEIQAAMEAASVNVADLPGELD